MASDAEGQRTSKCNSCLREQAPGLAISPNHGTLMSVGIYGSSRLTHGLCGVCSHVELTSRGMPKSTLVVITIPRLLNPFACYFYSYSDLILILVRASQHGCMWCQYSARSAKMGRAEVHLDLCLMHLPCRCYHISDRYYPQIIMRTFGIFALVAAAVVALAQGQRLNSPQLHYGHSIAKDDPRLGSISCDACKDVLGFLESRILAKGCDVGTNST